MSKRLIRTVAIVASLLSAGSAQAFVIDGDLSDWGVHRTSSASDWNPNSSVKAYTAEDQHDSYLNPGYGGQAYDAEAMYVSWDAQNMYIAIATGHNPNTVNNPAGNNFGAGDIAVDFGGDQKYEFGIELLGGGSTSKGHVYATTGANWALGIWTPAGGYVGSLFGNTATADQIHPTSLLGGTDVGTGIVAYTTVGQNHYGAWSNDLHYFYEVSVPLSAFGANWADGNVFDLHWTQNCANDSILVDPPVTVNPVPEPGTLALLPLGLLGIVAMRRKQVVAKPEVV